MIVYKGKSYHPTLIWRLIKQLAQDGFVLLIYYDNQCSMWSCQKLSDNAWFCDKSAYAAIRRTMEHYNLLDGQ